MLGVCDLPNGAVASSRDGREFPHAASYPRGPIVLDRFSFLVEFRGSFYAAETLEVRRWSDPVLMVGLATGCKDGKPPTWQELTGNAKTDEKTSKSESTGTQSASAPTSVVRCRMAEFGVSRIVWQMRVWRIHPNTASPPRITPKISRTVKNENTIRRRRFAHRCWEMQCLLIQTRAQTE